jgi:hypothetical protein
LARQCQKYHLLFDTADRGPRAKIIYETYLQPGADNKVNVPDSMVKKLEATMAKEPAAPDMFEVCANEIMQIISDNIYSLFLKQQKQEAEAVEAAKQAAEAAKKAAPPSGGGCCAIS